MTDDARTPIERLREGIAKMPDATVYRVAGSDLRELLAMLADALDHEETYNATTEQWRIVCASGLAHAITVTHDGNGTYDAALDCSPFGTYFLSAEGSADAAIRRLVMAAEIDVREIVPPGGQTKDEAIDTAVDAAMNDAAESADR